MVKKQQDELRGILGTTGHEYIEFQDLIPRLLQLFRDLKDRVAITDEKEVKSIYICGSYAENSAIPHASDLDVRYVLGESGDIEVPQEEFSQIATREWLKKYKSDSDIFGYVDAKYSHEPPREYESVRLI